LLSGTALRNPLLLYQTKKKAKMRISFLKPLSTPNSLLGDPLMITTSCEHLLLSNFLPMFLIIFQKKNSKKYNENPRKCIFDLFALFLAFSTPS
jgi:hypothetical protein